MTPESNLEKTAVEIRVTRNGYLVLPPTDYNNRSVSVLDEGYVFETFAALSDWLSLNLKDPAK